MQTGEVKKISSSFVKLYIELSVILKTSWNVSWLNYNMKHAQTWLKLLHMVALNKNKRCMKTFHKLKMLYSLYKSLYNIDIQSCNFFHFWKTINTVLFRSRRISSPSAPLSDFERVKGSTVTEKPDVRNRTRMLTDWSNGELCKHTSSVSTSGFFEQWFKRKIIQGKKKETLFCFTTNLTTLLLTEYQYGWIILICP